MRSLIAYCTCVIALLFLQSFGQEVTVTPPSQLTPLMFDATFFVAVDTADAITTVHYNLAGPISGDRLIPGTRLIPNSDATVLLGTSGQEVFQADRVLAQKRPLQIGADLPPLSWPMGFAYDSKRNEFRLVSLGGLGYLYSYSPGLKQWALVSSMHNVDLDSIVYEPLDDSLYGVQTQTAGNKLTILRFDSNGTLQDSISAGPLPFPVGPSGYKSELIAVDKYLVLLLEPRTAPLQQPDESRIYLIDLSVRRALLTYRKVWPPEPTAVPVISAARTGQAFTPAIQISAKTTAPVLSLELLANGLSLAKGESTTGLMDFESTWRNVQAGQYSLVALSTDASHTSRTSNPIVIHIEIEPLSSQGLGFQVNFATVSTKATGPTNVFTRAYTFADARQDGALLPAMRVVQDPFQTRYAYGVWQYSPYQVDRVTGAVSRWRPPFSLPPLNSPVGVTTDTKRGRVLLASLDGEGFLYAYLPREKSWQLLSSLQNHDLKALVYHAPDDSLYGLDNTQMVLYRFTPNGAYLSSISLPRLPVPFAGLPRYRAELVSAGVYLALILQENTPPLPGQMQHSFIYMISPGTGAATLTFVGFNSPPASGAAAQAQDDLSDPLPVFEADPVPVSVRIPQLTISPQGNALVRVEQQVSGQLESTANLATSAWTPLKDSRAPADTFIQPTNSQEFFRLSPQK